MCKICDEMRKDEGFSKEVAAASAQVMNRLDRSAIAGLISEKHSETGLSMDPAVFTDLYLTTFADGVTFALAQTIGQIGQLTLHARKVHVEIGKLQARYANTPTVLDDLKEMAEASTKIATKEVEVYSDMCITRAASLGISKAVLTGETKQEDMLDEEFAMIGERATQTNRLTRMIYDAMPAELRPEHCKQTGRRIVHELAKSYATNMALGQSYIQRGDPAFHEAMKGQL
jgi:hypothetical protein